MTTTTTTTKKSSAPTRRTTKKEELEDNKLRSKSDNSKPEPKQQTPSKRVKKTANNAQDAKAQKLNPKTKVEGELDKALIKDAQQVQCQFLTVSSTAQGLIERVRSGSSDWAWANNDENIGKLETLLSEASTQMR